MHGFGASAGAEIDELPRLPAKLVRQVGGDHGVKERYLGRVEPIGWRAYAGAIDLSPSPKVEILDRQASGAEGRKIRGAVCRRREAGRLEGGLVHECAPATIVGQMAWASPC